MCVFCRSLFVLFVLAIVLSVLLRFTDSDYPFGIFTLLAVKETLKYLQALQKSPRFSLTSLLNQLEENSCHLVLTGCLFQTCQNQHISWIIDNSHSPFKRWDTCEYFIWIEPFIRGHLSYKTTFSLSQRSWPLNTCLTVRPKKIICVFTVTRPTLIFASDPMHFYTEFG